jgi:hypothetical protein
LFLDLLLSTFLFLKLTVSCGITIKRPLKPDQYFGHTGSTSAEGALAYARIQSVAMTCQLRGLSFRDYWRQCLIHHLETGRALPLADYERRMTRIEKEAA